MNEINSIKNFSEREMEVIFECVKAAAYGPFFVINTDDDPYQEVHTLFGLTIEELRSIADQWPNVNFNSEVVLLAINNSINNLLGYPHRCSDEIWSKYISVSEKRLFEVYAKWRGEKVGKYFDGMI